MTSAPSATRHEIASWILAGAALLLVLHLRVLPALLAGLLVYQLVHILAPRLNIMRTSEQRRKIVAVALLSAAIVVLVALGIVGVLAFLRSDTGSLPALLGKMADVLDSSRAGYRLGSRNCCGNWPGASDHRHRLAGAARRPTWYPVSASIAEGGWSSASSSAR